MTNLLDRMTDKERALLRGAVGYETANGQYFPGHNLIMLVSKLWTLGQALEREKSGLQIASDEKGKIIASLRANVAKLTESADFSTGMVDAYREELPGLRRENHGYRREVADLRGKLQAAETNVEAILKMHKGEKQGRLEAEAQLVTLQAQFERVVEIATGQQVELEGLEGLRDVKERASSLFHEKDQRIKELEAKVEELAMDMLTITMENMGTLEVVSQRLKVYQRLLQALLCSTCFKPDCNSRQHEQLFDISDTQNGELVDLEQWAKNILPDIMEQVKAEFEEMVGDWRTEALKAFEERIGGEWEDLPDIPPDPEPEIKVELEIDAYSCEDCPYRETCDLADYDFSDFDFEGYTPSDYEEDCGEEDPYPEFDPDHDIPFDGDPSC